jgi:hypothetical protein
VVRPSPNAAPVREGLHSFLLSARVEGRRFCHVRWLMDDPAAATLMDLERVRGEEAFPRLAKELDPESLRHWMNWPQTELYAALPERFIADWDSTVNTRYGHQEDAVVGYNPHKRGRKSHHPLLCVAARTRLCLHLAGRPDDTVSATDWQPAMEKLWQRTVKLAVKTEWWQVKRLLRAAADVVGGNGAAVGIAGRLSATAVPSTHRRSLGMARSTLSNPDRLNLNCGF